MAELSAIGKMMKELKLAKNLNAGVNFTPFDVIELLGYIEGFEEYLHDLKQELFDWKYVAKILSEELTATREENSNICWEDVDESSYAQTLYKQLLDKNGVK